MRTIRDEEYQSETARILEHHALQLPVDTFINANGALMEMWPEWHDEGGES